MLAFRTYQRKPCDVRPLTKLSTFDIKPIARSRNIAIDTDMIWVNDNYLYFIQIIASLIDNVML